jgi:predicted GNAT family N-acyltransferase
MYIVVKKITSEAERQMAYDIRHTVFVIEQVVDPTEEYDEFDDACTHFIAYADKVACGTARWRFKELGIIKLERFAVLENYRGKGVGAALVNAVVNDLPYATKVMMHAQLHALPFYEKQGFAAYGDEFDEAGIRHYAMKLV